MTYLELFDGEWDDIKYKLKKLDKIKLKEICTYSSDLIASNPGLSAKKLRQLIRERCISNDIIEQRDKKIDLLL